VASLTTGALVILTLLFLAPLFSYLPKAVLAAVIIDAVVFGMINVKEMRRLWNVKRSDFWISLAAIIGVLSAGVLAGVIIGIVLSLGWLVYVAADPDIPVLGHKPGTHIFRRFDAFPDDETYPGMLMLRFDSGLFIASADSLGDRLRELSLEADPKLDTVVIDFAGINFIDSQGSHKIREILEAAEVRGVELRLARVRINVQRTLRHDGVIDALGEDHIYSTLYESVADRIQAASTEQA
jgi:MFS superfamily sulfate permease-like transporter